MANARTFLAWTRAAIGIMAFGFVVERFALFVRQLSPVLERSGLATGQEKFIPGAGSIPHGYSALLLIFLTNSI